MKSPSCSAQNSQDFLAIFFPGFLALFNNCVKSGWQRLFLLAWVSKPLLSLLQRLILPRNDSRGSVFIPQQGTHFLPMGLSSNREIG